MLDFVFQTLLKHYGLLAIINTQDDGKPDTKPIGDFGAVGTALIISTTLIYVVVSGLVNNDSYFFFSIHSPLSLLQVSFPVLTDDGVTAGVYDLRCCRSSCYG